MHVTSLERKTVRPGSLTGYSYYHSNRRPFNASAKPAARPKLNSRSKSLIRRSLLIVLVLLALIGLPLLRSDSGPQTSSITPAPADAKQIPPAPGVYVTSQDSKRCAGNQLDQLILVNITQRKLWACQGSKTVYSSPVITGIMLYDATMTPPGTYHIYAKQTDQTLTGSDQAGSWTDPVKYWMPFLTNQFGTYGFHDAPWRSNDQFGKVDPASTQASHGCVELPLTTSKWLYNWSQVGTTVTVEP